MFLNSHLLGEVEATCDRVAFIKDGRTVGDLSLKGAPDVLDVELRIAPVDEAVLAGLERFGHTLRSTTASSVCRCMMTIPCRR